MGSQALNKTSVALVDYRNVNDSLCEMLCHIKDKPDIG